MERAEAPRHMHHRGSSRTIMVVGKQETSGDDKKIIENRVIKAVQVWQLGITNRISIFKLNITKECPVTTIVKVLNSSHCRHIKITMETLIFLPKILVEHTLNQLIKENPLLIMILRVSQRK